MPEQIWDGPDVPPYLRFGGTTDAAMPLLWAHSEYVKLHRSAADHRVFDLVEPVYERYVTGTGQRKTTEVWKPNHQEQTVPTAASVLGTLEPSIPDFITASPMPTASLTEASTSPRGPPDAAFS